MKQKNRSSWREYEYQKQRLLQIQTEQRRQMDPEEYQRNIRKLAERLKL